MTDRVLPDLLPVSIGASSTRRSAGGRGRPAAALLGRGDRDQPRSLGALGTQSFFSPAAKHRVAIVLTDGESRPFDVRATARALAQPGVTPIFVQISSPGEAVYDSTGSRSPPTTPTRRADARGLAQAAGGEAFGESRARRRRGRRPRRARTGPARRRARGEHARARAVHRSRRPRAAAPPRLGGGSSSPCSIAAEAPGADALGGGPKRRPPAGVIPSRPRRNAATGP